MFHNEHREGVTIIRLSAPMMAWPSPGQYRTKGTYLTPTYSALTGLLHAAAGIPRKVQPPAELAHPEIAIRIDEEGTIAKDYQTVNPPPITKYRHLTQKDKEKLATVRKPDGKKDENALLVEKQYVQNQTALVAYSDPDKTILKIFLNPVWALYAGRKSCMLTHPFVIGHIANINIFNVFSVLPTVTAQKEQHMLKNDTRHQNSTTRTTIFFSQPVMDHYTEKSQFDAPGDGDNVGKTYRQKKRWTTRLSAPTNVKDYYDLIAYVDSINSAH